MKNTIEKAFKKSNDKLSKNETDTAQLDSEILLAHAMGKTREFVLSHPSTKLNAFQMAKFEKLVERRLDGEPIAYILGQKEFYGLNFKVDKNVLVPRPETEIMVDETLRLLGNMPDKKSKYAFYIIDIGTGCGNIIVSIAKNIIGKNTFSSNINESINSNFEFYAIDKSLNALKIAKENAKIHGLDAKIKFMKGHYLNPVLQNFGVYGDKVLKDKTTHCAKVFILANLPYLSEKIYQSAQSSVKIFEPKDALVSGCDGLGHYRKLFSQIKALFALFAIPMTVMIEISPEQKTPALKIIRACFPKTKIRFFRDLSGKWRVASFEL